MTAEKRASKYFNALAQRSDETDEYIVIYIYILKIDRSIIYKKLRKPGYFLSRTRNIDQTIVARLSRTIDLDPARFATSKQHLYTQKAAAVIYSVTRSLSVKRPSIVRASPKVTAATPKQIARPTNDPREKRSSRRETV